MRRLTAPVPAIFKVLYLERALAHPEALSRSPTESWCDNIQILAFNEQSAFSLGYKRSTTERAFQFTLRFTKGRGQGPPYTKFVLFQTFCVGIVSGPPSDRLSTFPPYPFQLKSIPLLPDLCSLYNNWFCHLLCLTSILFAVRIPWERSHFSGPASILMALVLVLKSSSGRSISRGIFWSLGWRITDSGSWIQVPLCTKTPLTENRFFDISMLSALLRVIYTVREPASALNILIIIYPLINFKTENRFFDVYLKQGFGYPLHRIIERYRAETGSRSP